MLRRRPLQRSIAQADAQSYARWRSAQRGSNRVDEHDIVGTVFLIGGGSYRADAKSVVDQDGDAIAYIRREGVFARLLSSQYVSRYSRIECPGSDESEEAVAIFSPRACGVYGMPELYLSDAGRGEERGTFRLDSRGHTVKVPARTTALLQIVEAS